MGELYHWRTIDDDNGKQTGGCRQHCIDWILQEPTLVELWNQSQPKVEPKKLREFLDTERARSNGNKLEETVGMFPIGFIDIF